MRILTIPLALLVLCSALRAADEAPPASKPVEKNGLSMVVTLAKAQFVAGQPLQLTVTFTNTTQQTVLLYDALWPNNYEVKAGEWKAVYLKAAERKPLGAEDSKQLDPGKSITVPIELSGVEYQWTGPTDKPIAPTRELPAGKYPVVVSRTFESSPLRRWKHPHWAGPITSEPVEVTIAAKPAVAPAK